MNADLNICIHTASALLPSIPSNPLKKASMWRYLKFTGRRSMSQELSRKTEATEYVYCLERGVGGGGGEQ